MLTFVVPVKSAQLASDWPAFCTLFERTLRSICNQENQNYRVIVVCHELPNISYENDKVDYIEVPFAVPVLESGNWGKNRELKEGDKANKILVGYEEAVKYKTDYIMVVDADDCISNKISGFVDERNGNVVGWYINKGYYYKEGAGYLFLNRKTFNNLCGSCIIIRADLFTQLIVDDPWLYYYHELKVLPNGNLLNPLPFIGALYSMANGENHFMSAEHAIKLIKKPKIDMSFFKVQYNKIAKYRIRFITNKFKKNFGFYKI